MNPFEDRRVSPFEGRQTSSFEERQSSPFGGGFEPRTDGPRNIPKSIVDKDNNINISRYGETVNKPVRPTPPIKETEDDEIEFDVDELVKKIDAKIAELEREEALERQRSKSMGGSTTTVETEKRPVITESTPTVAVTKEEPKQTETIVLNDIDEDDDDFFDDFFDN